MAGTLDARLRTMVAAVFGIPEHHVTDDASPHTIQTWDSVQHIHLVLALESEFGVQFDADDIPALTSVAVIREHLVRAGVV
jgi:acyl carrier protein